MKRLAIAVILLLCLVGAACADEAAPKIRVGNLSFFNMNNDEYEDFLVENWSGNLWNVYAIYAPEYAKFATTDSSAVQFDSLADMIMALKADKIDSMEMPEPVAKYFFSLKENREKFIPVNVVRGVEYFMSMGFLEGSKWYQPFNEALKAMTDDETLLMLKAHYIFEPSEKSLSPVKFEHFPDAETVKIAVTGDMPPMDFIAADGTPAGFNTALLAEIAKRLKVNVEIVNIDSGARVSALTSGRADGVFWFWYDTVTPKQRQAPKEIMLTEPYCSWDTFMYVGNKVKK